MKLRFDRRAVCGACGTLALVIFLNATPFCEDCYKHHSPHVPETHRSTTTAASVYSAYITFASDSTMTTTQPIFNDKYFKGLS